MLQIEFFIKAGWENQWYFETFEEQRRFWSVPIFIFCVVQAQIDRPCALCVLLRSLCDRINKIGEIGYYLASFEAAVCHIQEIDLAEEQGQQMRSFLSVNLDSN